MRPCTFSKTNVRGRASRTACGNMSRSSRKPPCLPPITVSNARSLLILKMLLKIVWRAQSSFCWGKGGARKVDSLDQAARSALMARVRSKNTLPEMIVRKPLFAAGSVIACTCESYRARRIWLSRRERRCFLFMAAF